VGARRCAARRRPGAPPRGLRARPPAAADALERSIDVGALAEQELGCLELDAQTAERVREHVVDLTCDPRALVERRGSMARRFGFPGLHDERLGRPPLRDVLAAVSPSRAPPTRTAR